MNEQRASGPGNQAGGPLARWWRLPDQFEWLSGYLRARGLAWPTRVLMALISAGLMLMGAATPTMRNVPPVWAWTFGAAAVLTGITYSALWLRGWPETLLPRHPRPGGGASLCVYHLTARTRSTCTTSR